MAKSEKGFEPTFENGGFWEYYKDLERQFEDFLDYVPYLEGNEKTYSFRLANLLLAIGAHVDSAFKEMARYHLFSEKESCKEILRRADDKLGTLTSGVRAFNEIYGISSEEVTFKCLPKRMKIIPFKEAKPEWWDSYNDIKHDFGDNLSKANLRVVRDALAGAFLLNVIHYPAADWLSHFKLFTPKYAPRGFEQIYDKFRGKSMQPIYVSDVSSIDPFLIETPLFIYDYEKVKMP
ncbi:MAG: hypothetical protein ABSF44_10755 [Candidatus Bathyarchaeia archaeon]|jgi:hypothetical protein